MGKHGSDRPGNGKASLGLLTHMVADEVESQHTARAKYGVDALQHFERKQMLWSRATSKRIVDHNVVSVLRVSKVRARIFFVHVPIRQKTKVLLCESHHRRVDFHSIETNPTRAQCARQRADAQA